MSETITAFQGVARVVIRCDGATVTLDDGGTARRALGCLVRPEVGDRVLMWRDGESGDGFVLSVLDRPNGGTVTVDAGARLDVHAADRLSIRSEGEIALSAPLGALTMVAQRLSLSAIDGLILTARSAVAAADTLMIQARDVLTTRARHHLMSARKEMRLEADRIQLS